MQKVVLVTVVILAIFAVFIIGFLPGVWREKELVKSNPGNAKQSAEVENYNPDNLKSPKSTDITEKNSDSHMQKDKSEVGSSEQKNDLALLLSELPSDSIRFRLEELVDYNSVQHIVDALLEALNADEYDYEKVEDLLFLLISVNRNMEERTARHVEIAHMLVDSIENVKIKKINLSTALHVIGYMRCNDEEVTRLLFGIIGDVNISDYNTLDTATSSLSKIYDKVGPGNGWFENLVAFLNDDRYDMSKRGRAKTVIPYLLGEIGDSRAIPILIDALSSDRFFNPAVIKALGKLKSEEAVSYLSDYLQLELPKESVEAITARPDSRMEYNQDDKKIAQYMRESWLSIASAEALGEIGTNEAKNKLLLTLDRLVENDEVASHFGIGVLQALAKSGNKTALEMLIEKLQSAKPGSTCVGSGDFHPGVISLTTVGKDNIAKALEEATGRKYGTDYEKWKEYLERQQK